MTYYNSFAAVRRRLVKMMIPVVCLAASALGAAATDPPGRVARVNFLEGSGSMQGAGVDGWSNDLLNRPLTGGDRVWIDERSRAEMHVGSTALRLGSRTAVQVLAVDDHSVRLSLTAGSISVHLRDFDSGDRFDIETPAGEVSLRQPGGYRVDVDDSNARAYLAVWNGSAEVSGPSGARAISQEQSAELVPGAEPAIDTASAGNTDSLDEWAEARDQSEDQSSAAQYVSRDVVGYQDLDGYGQWVDEPSYGMVWVPVVAAGWAPYHYGYWNWIAPWGWNWIAYEPWGFAPSHYGRWVYAPHGWAWVPGPRWGATPVYSPALVAWRGERYPRTNPDIMHRPKVGWVPLGFNEVYDPPFHASADYLRAANLSNTHLGQVDVERYIDARQHSGAQGPERRYANDYVAGAYSDAPREAFAAANSIGAPRAVAMPNDSMHTRFTPHEVSSAAPVDRPVAHPVGYAPVTMSDRPPAQASTHSHFESSRSLDRPPRQSQDVAGRTARMSYAAPPQSYRQTQPVVRQSEPRQYYLAPERSAASPSRAGGHDAHHSAARSLR
jgi:FecR protein